MGTVLCAGYATTVETTGRANSDPAGTSSRMALWRPELVLCLAETTSPLGAAYGGSYGSIGKSGIHSYVGMARETDECAESVAKRLRLRPSST